MAKSKRDALIESFLAMQLEQAKFFNLLLNIKEPHYEEQISEPQKNKGWVSHDDDLPF